MPGQSGPENKPMPLIRLSPASCRSPTDVGRLISSSS
jgi:hypothetical protein